MRAGLALFAVGALESGFAADASVRQKILKVDKAGLTDATVQLDDNYRQGVVDIIRWTHQQGRKFMFIVSPNESPDTFNSDTIAITRFLEDQNAAPDIYGVTLHVANASSWVDFMAALSLRREGLPAGTRVRLLLDGADIATQAQGKDGFRFYRDQRLLPASERKLSLSVNPIPSAGRVVLELRPYPGSVFVRDTLAVGLRSMKGE